MKSGALAIATLLVVLFGSILLSLAWLDGYAQGSHAESRLKIDTLCWSQEDSGLFLASESSPIIWVSRDGQNRRELFELPKGGKLLGCRGNPDELILRLPDGGIEIRQTDGATLDLPKKLESCDFIALTRQQLFFSCLIEGQQLEAVEVERGEDFEEERRRPQEESPSGPPPGWKGPEVPTFLGRRALELSSWHPRMEEPRVHVRIPFQSNENLEIAGLEPSPDGRFLALGLRFAPNQPLGVWVYDHKEEELLWSTIEVSGSKVDFAWSPDSVSLLIAGKDSLYMQASVLETKYTKIPTIGRVFTPKWCDNGRLFLMEGTELYRLDPRDFVAHKITNSLDHKPSEVRLSEKGDIVAYFSQSARHQSLHSVRLETGRQRSLLRDLAGEERRTEMTYRLARAVHIARMYWTGGRVPPEGKST